MGHDIVVVGAGPAGSYSASRLSALGYRTALIEEHTEGGRPQQCAGLVNPRLFELKLLKGINQGVVLKDIFGADIFSPSGHILPLKGKEVKALSIDRAAFDKELIRTAARSGAEVLTHHKAVSIKKRSIGGWTVTVKGKGCGLSLDCDLLMGCDGPSSLVRRSAGIGPPKETITGVSIEAISYPVGPPKDRIGMFTGSKVAKGFFAWTIPSSGTNGLRLGVSSIDPGGLMSGLRTFLNDRRLTEFLSIDGPEDLKLAETSMTLGTIPMGSPDRTVLKDLVLVGDSAGMAKPTSGGGIYPALRAVDLLSSIVEGRGELSPSVLSEFEKVWKKGYGRELERAFVARRILSDISDEELDLALERLSRKETLELINSEGDIDQPMALAVSLVKKDPGLLMLLPRFLPHLKKVL